MLRSKALSLATAACLMAPALQAAVVFSSNFDSSPVASVLPSDPAASPNSGVFTAADMGTVGGGGNWSFGGTATGGFGGISRNTSGGADRAYVFGHNNATLNNAQGVPYINPSNTYSGENIPGLAPNVTPGTYAMDSGKGPLLNANFASSSFTGGDTVSIKFDWGVYGTSNNGAGVKAQFVRGLDASGAEVFEVLLVAGSGDNTRDIFVRGALDANYTITGTGNGNGLPQGTNVVTGMLGTINSVANNTSGLVEPAAPINVDVLLANGLANFTFSFPQANSPNPTSPQSLLGVAINSAATSIAKLEFSSNWGNGPVGSVNGQNKGYWLDNVVVDAVTAIPEPSAFLFGGLATSLVCLAWRRS